MTEIAPARSGHVVIGVDTHKHIHVAAVMDSVGGILATLTIGLFPVRGDGERRVVDVERLVVLL